MAMVERRATRARNTSSDGDSVPSEAVVWRWRSINAQGPSPGEGGRTLHAERRPAAAGRLGVGVLDREPAARDVVDEVDLGAAQVARADRIHEQLHAVRLDDRIGRRVPLALVVHEAVLETRAAAALDEHPEARLGLVFFV